MTFVNHGGVQPPGTDVSTNQAVIKGVLADDVVVAVDWEMVVGLPHSGIINLLKTQARPLRVTFARGYADNELTSELVGAYLVNEAVVVSGAQARCDSDPPGTAEHHHHESFAPVELVVMGDTEGEEDEEGDCEEGEEEEEEEGNEEDVDDEEEEDGKESHANEGGEEAEEDGGGDEGGAIPAAGSDDESTQQADLFGAPTGQPMSPDGVHCTSGIHHCHCLTGRTRPVDKIDRESGTSFYSS